MNDEDRRQLLAAWLREQLDARHWTTADLSRASGAPHGSVSALVLGNKNLGLKLAKDIAKGLDVPLETVLCAAGHMEKSDPETELQIQILHDLKDLENRDQSVVAAFVKTLLHQRPPSNNEKPARKDKRGKAQT